jgi:nucleoside-diphosphate-sugar epimerase
MRACIDFHAATHVLLSSADVYPNQSDPSANSEESSIHPSQLSVYGLCKYMAECVVMNRCPRRIIIRLGGLLGPGLRKNPVFDLLTGQPLRVHPDSEFGYIHTDEVVKIVTELLHRDRANEIFNVCGEGMVSIRQIMEWTGRSNTVPDKTTKPLHYEINNRRLASFWKIPSSAETAKEFISWRKNQNQKP